MNLTGLTVLGSEEELVSVSGSGEVEGSAACLGGGLECGRWIEGKLSNPEPETETETGTDMCCSAQGLLQL